MFTSLLTFEWTQAEPTADIYLTNRALSGGTEPKIACFGAHCVVGLSKCAVRIFEKIASELYRFLFIVLFLRIFRSVC